MRNLDINSDLGEGEPARRTAALMKWITSANIACGGHAGDADSIHRCIALALRHGVRVGAHPGALDREGFGRRPVQIDAGELESIVVPQVELLARIARREGAALTHIKLHGALYHAVESSSVLARSFLKCVGRRFPGTEVYAMARGRVWTASRRLGVTVRREAFVDRGYAADGSLIPRDAAGALISGRVAIQERVRGLLEQGRVRSVEGGWVRLQADTLCVHADSPDALRTLRWAAGLTSGSHETCRGRPSPSGGR